jgi:predicted RNase H-like nuclease
MIIIGIDLAWGDKKPDGLCIIEATRSTANIRGYAYPKGDVELMETLNPIIKNEKEIFITIDAPIICPNKTGTRPVDRLTHRLFHREHAACHPANYTKCPRPVRVRQLLEKAGMKTGWLVGINKKTVAEVYPHPAMVRMFKLPRIVKYKKGNVANRRSEFKRLQRLMKKCIRDLFPFLTLDKKSIALLKEPWSKPIEDQTDALFCALLGLWHWKYQCKKSEIIGNTRTGFILLPIDLRKKKLSK